MTSADGIFNRSNLVQNKGIGNRQVDPLPRLLAQIADRIGMPLTIRQASSRPWASALFEGRRHVMLLGIEGQDATTRRDHFIRGLEDVEWKLPGHFVADITVDDIRPGTDEIWIELSALTIEDW